MKSYLSLLTMAALIITVQAAAVTPAFASEPADADNPAATRLPESASTPTAPSNDSEDARVTAQIERALLNDKTLSSLAHNVTIATNSQAVVLRGAVKAADKDRIETLAQQFAGTRQVDDQLTIKAQ